LPQSSASRSKAEKDGLIVNAPSEAAAWADVIMILVPDTKQKKLYEEAIAPNLKAGKTLMFAHGFNIRFGAIKPPVDVDVSMSRQKLLAIACEKSSRKAAELQVFWRSSKMLPARPRNSRFPTRAALAVLALESWKHFHRGNGNRSLRRAAVLCGGVSELIKAGFETLTAAGYQPEVAYFECLHELKLIVDLIYRGGLSYMRYSISDTAEHGDYTAGPRIVTQQTRDEMKKLLAEIRDGSFAKKVDRRERKGLPELPREAQSRATACD